MLLGKGDVLSLVTLLLLIKHLYLSGMWLDVALRTDTKKASRVYKGLNYMLKEFDSHSRLKLILEGPI